MGGRHGPKCVVGLKRNGWSTCAEIRSFTLIRGSVPPIGRERQFFGSRDRTGLAAARRPASAKTFLEPQKRGRRSPAAPSGQISYYRAGTRSSRDNVTDLPSTPRLAPRSPRFSAVEPRSTQPSFNRRGYRLSLPPRGPDWSNWRQIGLAQAPLRGHRPAVPGPPNCRRRRKAIEYH